MRPLFALLVAMLFARTVFADAEEASLHLSVGPAALRIEDAEDLGATTTTPGLQLDARLSYGLTNTFALDVGLGGTVSGSASLGEQNLGGRIAGTMQDERAVRVTAGLAARWGVAWIPSATVRLGYQHRFITGGAHFDRTSGILIAPSIPDRQLNDLLVAVGVGFEHRFNARWTAGLSIQAVHAVSFDGNSFDALEIPLSITYSFYPRWFAPSGWLPGGEPLEH